MRKEYESEMSPRRRPPPIHGAHMVARVQPLVPEVSLWFPPSTAISQAEPLQEVPRPQPQPHPAKRQPLAPIYSNRGDATAGQRPPSPSKCNQLNATADFSISSDTQIFERLEKLITKKEELATPRPPPTAQSPNASKEVLDLLEWQNGQIRDLQEKLGQLMAAGGRRESAVTDDGSLGRPHSHSAASLPQRLTSPEGLQPSASSPTLRTSEDSGTQTSVPSSPLLPLRSMPRRREDSRLISMQESTSSPEYISKSDSSALSIALGESASMHSGSGVRDENPDDANCEDIIAQLQRARRRRPLPEEERRQPERGDRAAVAKPRKPLASKEDDLVSGTVARLRQIGVSFISPEEMRSSQQPPLPEINTLYPARLRVDDMGVSTNSSLAINSAALKNLDDRQLTQMARRRTGPAVEQGDVMRQIAAAKNKPYELDTGSEECSSLTRYGLPESAMTMGTRQFLMGNRIVDEEDEPGDKILSGNKTGSRNRSEKNAFLLHDLTQMLQQPKLKP